MLLGKERDTADVVFPLQPDHGENEKPKQNNAYAE
jgi:hypothetical protein